MKKVLFACYGSGHVRMVLPVAQALAASGRVQVQVLGLTTAAPVVRAAGLALLQFRDFVRPEDAAAVARGRDLLRDLPEVVDPEETAAYLGLSYADLVQELGEDGAQARYRQLGRQGFLPRATLRRILGQVRPDVLVATNAPRAERAAIEAAGELGIPAVCVIDLFAVDEVRWIGRAGYAQRLCVLNQGVREFLVASGRSADEISVTGNPAFDGLQDPEAIAQGHTLRASRGWQGRRVLLWPTQVEPAVHPFSGVPGDPALPQRALAAVCDWVLAQPDAILCVRPRAGENVPALPADPRIVVTGQEVPLAVLLHAVDLVVTLTSTVGLEGHLAGARLVQVRGSVFDESMPLARFGIADAEVPVSGLPQALAQWSVAPRHAPGVQGQATARVAAVVEEFLRS